MIIKYCSWRDNADVFGQQMNSLPTLSRCPPHRRSLPTEMVTQREEQAGSSLVRYLVLPEELTSIGRLAFNLCSRCKDAGASSWQRVKTAQGTPAD